MSEKEPRKKFLSQAFNELLSGMYIYENLKFILFSIASFIINFFYPKDKDD